MGVQSNRPQFTDEVVDRLTAEVCARVADAGADIPEPLVARAVRMACRAHAPYSRFHVGAAVVDESGHGFGGCNVENASYPVGTCAERNALAAMVAGSSDGSPAVRLFLVAVQEHDGELRHVACSPCGACRQAVTELQRPGAPCRVSFFAGDPPALREATADELLPFGFRL